MKPFHLIAGMVAVGLLAACGTSTLASETAAVGTACPWTAHGIVTGVTCRTPALSPEMATYVLSEGELHVAMCSAGTGATGNLHLRVFEPTLGTHAIAPEEASAYFYLDPPSCYDCSGWDGVSGSVTIDGYDPVAHTVCGHFDIEVGQAGRTPRSQVGAFLAIMP